MNSLLNLVSIKLNCLLRLVSGRMNCVLRLVSSHMKYLLRQGRSSKRSSCSSMDCLSKSSVVSTVVV